MADGAGPAPRAIRDDAFIASTAMTTWVFERPDNTSAKLGYLRAGAVMKTSQAPAGTTGCPQGWYPIEPAGYVCRGPTATTDLTNDVVRASTRRPNLAARLPYMYGVLRSAAPMYTRLPSSSALSAIEPDLSRHLHFWLRDRVMGASYAPEVWLDGQDREVPSPREALEAKLTESERTPWFLKDGRQPPNLAGYPAGTDLVAGRGKRRNGLAFIDSFLNDGRRYNVTTDLLVVPADKLRPVRGSAFHGFEIPRDVDLPFAIVLRENAHPFRFDAARNKRVNEGEIASRTAVALTGKKNLFGGKFHYETKGGTWISEEDASYVEAAKKMPGWATQGEKWIDINITKQLLIAYEGTTPVFATLVSTGEAGLDDPKTTRATARGIFRIFAKHLTATMDSDVVGEEFELRDIPYVQYFQDGYALHTAYWHDSFGQPRSHGCVNLAPEDAKRLFLWTDPPIPPGWHAVMKGLTGTVVFTHR